MLVGYLLRTLCFAGTKNTFPHQFSGVSFLTIIIFKLEGISNAFGFVILDLVA